MSTTIDRILGRRPIPESSSLIPDDAVEIPDSGGSNQGADKPKPVPDAPGSETFVSTGLALVAPDTTPKSTYPLSPSMVPSPVPSPAQATSAAQMAAPAAPVAPASYFPRPAPVASDSALSDPALAAIVGESLTSISETFVGDAGAKAASALQTGAPMPPPTEGNTKKICDAARRFIK